jgi:hypothetical protein
MRNPLGIVVLGLAVLGLCLATATLISLQGGWPPHWLSSVTGSVSYKLFAAFVMLTLAASQAILMYRQRKAGRKSN